MGKTLEKVWVVMGSAGEYSDHREWYICFYLDEANARRHVEQAAMRSRDIKTKLRVDDCGTCWGSKPENYCPEHKDLKNVWDPQGWDSSSEGINYTAFPVERGRMERGA